MLISTSNIGTVPSNMATIPLSRALADKANNVKGRAELKNPTMKYFFKFLLKKTFFFLIRQMKNKIAAPIANLEKAMKKGDNVSAANFVKSAKLDQIMPRKIRIPRLLFLFMRELKKSSDLRRCRL